MRLSGDAVVAGLARAREATDAFLDKVAREFEADPELMKLGHAHEFVKKYKRADPEIPTSRNP